MGNEVKVYWLSITNLKICNLKCSKIKNLSTNMTWKTAYLTSYELSQSQQKQAKTVVQIIYLQAMCVRYV
jgi:hypothetical protein